MWTPPSQTSEVPGMQPVVQAARIKVNNTYIVCQSNACQGGAPKGQHGNRDEAKEYGRYQSYASQGGAPRGQHGNWDEVQEYGNIKSYANQRPALAARGRQPGKWDEVKKCGASNSVGHIERGAGAVHHRAEEGRRQAGRVQHALPAPCARPRGQGAAAAAGQGAAAAAAAPQADAGVPRTLEYPF